MVARPNYVNEAERAGFTPEALTALSEMSGTASPPPAPAHTPSAPRVSMPSVSRTNISTATHPTPATRDLKPVGLATQTVAPTRPDFPRPSQVRQLAPEASRPVARTTDLPVRLASAAPVRVSAPQPVSVVPAAARITDPVPIHLVRALAPLPANQMDVEIGPYIAELAEAPRPSVRERAATALAEGRYGWRPEVKQHLIRAAQQDPAPSVRAHCIRLLSRLGYHETRYLHYLMGCSDAGQPEVNAAARAALDRLAVRY